MVTTAGTRSHCPEGQTSRPARAVTRSLAGPCATADRRGVDAHARGRHAAGPPGPAPVPGREAPGPDRLPPPALLRAPGNRGAAANALQQLQRASGNTGVQRLVGGEPPAALIVEDSVAELAEGQLRRGEFLVLLRSSVGAALAAAGPLAEASGRDELDR